MKGRTILVAVVLSIVAFTSAAELQNVCVNGWSSLIRKENRIAEVYPINVEAANEPQYIRIQGEDFPWSGVQKDIQIPETQHQTFLCFYSKLSANKADARPHYLAIVVDGYRAFQGDIKESDWQLKFVDLNPWRGKTVSIRFHTFSRSGEVTDIAIGLPRVVVCDGPLYAGIGGLFSPNRSGHGMCLALSKESSSYKQDLDLKDETMPEPALLLTRVDCLTDAQIHIAASGGGEKIVFGSPGYNWLAIPFAKDDAEGYWFQLYTVEGEVERGPIDLIPNFLVGDDQRLADIDKLLESSDASRLIMDEIDRGAVINEH